MFLLIVFTVVGILAIGGALWALHESEDGIAGICGIVALFCVAGVIFTAIILGSVKYETFTVNDKVAAATSDGHEYQIFTDDGNVYKDEDSFTFFKFNSSNVYAQLQKGHTYKCKVSGFRVPILSAKNNIISCTEVSK